MTTSPPGSLVVMGVAGCGKSTLSAAIASELGLRWLDGDEFHSDASRRKMARGEPLNDDDRASWLARLCEELRREPRLVIACSALKRAYRDQLRAAAPGLRFAFLDIDKAESRRRVSSRASHFFAASLVDSQFETLEPPTGEPGVLRLDGRLPVDALRAETAAWLR
jgi:gluconokinase